MTEITKEALDFALAEAAKALGEMRARKDAAYEERNRVVALLARIYQGGRAITAIEGWDPEWHHCVYMDTPDGQLSWHYHDSQAFLFESLPEYTGTWDGHTTEQKYERIDALCAKFDSWSSWAHDLLKGRSPPVA